MRPPSDSDDQDAAEHAARAGRGAQRRQTSGIGRREFEDVDARRVERADLVRSIIRKRRDAATAEERLPEEERTGDAAPGGPDDTVQLRRGRRAAPGTERGIVASVSRAGDVADDAAAGEAPRAFDDGPASPVGSAATVGDGEAVVIVPGGVPAPGEPDTSETVQVDRSELRRAAAAPDAPHAVSAEKTVRIDREELRRTRGPGAASTAVPDTSDTVRIDPLRHRAADPTVDGVVDDAAPGGAGHGAPEAENPFAPPTAVIPVVEASSLSSPSDAAPIAFGILRRWRADAETDRQALAEAQAEARSERARDHLDPSGDLRRAAEQPGGGDFLRHLLDDVVRPEDAVVAGQQLGDLNERIPAAMSRRARLALRAGAFAGPGVPWLTAPFVKRVAWAVFGREVVTDTTDARLNAIAHAREIGAIPRVRLLGDPVLGEHGAHTRLQRLAALVADPTVPEVEFTLADVDPQTSLWDFDGAVERIAAKLAPVYAVALDAPQPNGAPGTGSTLLVLRATGSRDLELAVQVFLRLLDEDALLQLPMGIAIPAEFPETPGLLRRVSGRAHMRREDLGAPVTVAVTHAGDLAAERVDAVLGGWRLASFAEEGEVAANTVRLLDQLLHPDHAPAVRAEIDADLAREAALAIAIGQARGRPDPVRVVVPVGAGDPAVERLRSVGAEVVQRLPLVPDESLRPAVDYLLRRVDVETASASALEWSEASLAGRESIHPDDARLLDAIGRMFQLPGGQNRQQERVDADDAATVTAGIELELFPDGLFVDEAEPAAVAPAPPTPTPRDAPRTTGADDELIPELAPVDGEFLPPGASAAQRPVVPDEATENPAETGPSARLTEIVLGLRRGRILRNTFRNAPDTDLTIPANREWASRVQRRVARSEIGVEEARRLVVTSIEQVDELVARAAAAAPAWRDQVGWERAANLEKVAKALEANRARLIEVSMSEASATIADADHDVSRAIDVANHAAHLARQLDRMQGAAFHPVGVSVVATPWSPPVAGVLGPVLTALAAGSAVVAKPSPRTARIAAVAIGVLWDAGIPRDLLQVAVCDERIVTDEQLGQRLIVDERVERVLLNGTWETARTFLQWRPSLPLIAGSAGKNSIVVTPSADLDQAARDVAVSAFRSTGQRAAHAGSVILVGSVARSARFHEQLADAVTSMRLGYPTDPATAIGPLIAPPEPELRFALTELAEGESWLVEPRQLDDTGRLWSPGVRAGVKAGSYTHVTEFFGPVLSIMHALTLGDAIAMQNATPYGLSAGLHSLDRAEIARWIQEVEAGNLMINRDLLGDIVQRQPFGGWRRSAVGRSYKTGGPNALMALGTWRIDPGQQSSTLHLRGLDEKAVRLIEAAQSSLDYDAFDRVRRSALSDQIAWNEEFGEVSDVSNLGIERNLLRYRPAAVTVRLAEGGDLADLVRVLVGARVVRAVPDVSVPFPLPVEIAGVLDQLQFVVRVEGDEAFAERTRRRELDSLRIRLIGGDRAAFRESVGGDPDLALWADPVTNAGRVELLPFLREQTISITAHRHGRPDDRVAELFPHEKLVDPDAPIGTDL
ncbi:aldehyde dehydrogenase family protein [Pseudoclavibacter chungangensis]|uniref:Aldehyde dehydrogenase family protein n=1 Tax=Pseudoclavibacter chungangensis TaxID=587635 RepID=A0A7J5BQ27_9MICO|nr:aldehyde dehydrogenase family protein [Pseudoclavibacter chungangensis]KAB1654573.1 aldehyde dehydrogenase family protein [Pseudoclavibacter chungangensis]NYJ68184.1 RHH-type proline utilization regulon transcriptional repressor/proline dehydrogenase/delta 1-pyrroline-5-carboxylate dehydrogenase [Pseudoclavibacter chungangensis]